MALSRRHFLLALPLGAGATAAACGTSSRRSRDQGGYQELATTTPDHEAKGTILVVMPETTQTNEVWTALSDELGEQYRLVSIRAEESSTVAAIAEGFRRYRPSALVLMNNPTVAAYRSFQHQSGLRHFPPAVMALVSFLDGHPTQIANAVGISYEVPLITVVTNLRKLFTSPTERVGVIVRAAQRDFVKRQSELAAREQIVVVEQDVGADPSSSELKWAIRRLKRQVDVLWILNDDRLLTPRLIADGWLPGLNERPYRPTIVGAASLVSPAQSFGTFAVLPDHAALGVQAAELVFDLADRGWVVPVDGQVHRPLSTTMAVDLVQTRRRFSLRPDALRQVDRLLE